MLPADGVHGYLRVQTAFYAYVALTLAITVVLWWAVVPTDLIVVAFLVIAAVLLVPFWPLFVSRHQADVE